MKSEPIHFSPTSAGVRTDHLNFHQNTNKNNKLNKINRNNSNKIGYPPTRTRVLPPAQLSSSTATSDEDDRRRFIGLQQVVIRKPVPGTGNKTVQKLPPRCPQRKSNKMRNCLILTGIVVIISLLSFVLLVECRSIRTNTSSKKVQNDAEISSESRVQDNSFQEPDSGSSEEYPAKVILSTGSSTSETSKRASSSSSTPSSSTTKASSSGKRGSTGSSATSSVKGRLTRSRVSVICTGGHAGVLEEEPGSASTRKSKKKEIDLPTYLPRETDDDEEDDNVGEKFDSDEDTTLASGESQKVITVTGYSHVTGGKPEAKASVKSGSHAAIKYVPKPTTESSTAEDESISGSEEIVEVVSVKPSGKGSKGTSEKHNSKKSSKHATSTTTRSPGKHRQSKRESGEDSVEDQIPETTPRQGKSSKSSSSKRSSKHGKSSTTTTERYEKGDSGELDDEALFPTTRKPKSDNKKGKKASERRQKATTVIPIAADSEEFESAEAEPESIPATTKKPESSRHKSSKSNKRSASSSSDSKKLAASASSLKSVSVHVDEDSSEEFNMEEMPYSQPSHDSGKKGKSRKTSSSTITSSSSSSVSRSSKMGSRTAASKQRTGTFSSLELND